MSMIKRGHSDNSRPSIISSSRVCKNCGYSDSASKVCPKCQGVMVLECNDPKPDSGNCPNGICSID